MLSPAARLRLFFLTQFLSVGMVNAYSGIWFAGIGLSTVQIGVIGAAPIALLLCLTLVVGRLADRARDWRQVIVRGMTAAGLLPLGLLMGQGFWLVLAVWTLLTTAQRVTVPVADAAAIRMARREGLDFGSLRALGTIGYLTVILGAGLVLADAGAALFLPLFIAFGLVRMAAAFGLPNLRAAPRPPDLPRVPLRLPARFVLPLLAWALIDTNHIILNSFLGLLWSDRGLSTPLIGALITLGALAETAMFLGFRHVARRVSPQTLLLAAAGFSVLRWLGMALAPGIAGLVALQLMHALTYAMGFLAVTNFIADHTPEDNAAEAQSLLSVLELAVSMGVLVLFGWVAGIWGEAAFVLSAALAAAGGACLIVARRLPPG